MKTIFIIISVLFFSTPVFSSDRYQYNNQVYLKVGYRYNSQTDFDGNPLRPYGNIPKINIIECRDKRCNIDGHLFLKVGNNFYGQSDFDGNRLRYTRYGRSI
jgi:hypothetical protein